MSPGLSEPDRVKYMTALATPLKILATSKLQVYVAGEETSENEKNAHARGYQANE
jgi:hypothetical protein